MFEQIFANNKIDTVFHLISTTIPGASSNVRFDVETNLLPTVDLLDHMARHGVRRIVFISSGGAVYGNTGVRNRENQDVFPISSYGAVKIAIEKYLFMYAHHGKILPLVVRLSNPYGPYHTNRTQGIVNVALRAATRGEPFAVWGDGSNRKDYMFVGDCVDVILDLVSANAWCQVVNVGSGLEHSINDILKEIRKFVPAFSWQYSESRSFDVRDFSLDIGKLEALTGQRRFTEIHEGIQQTYKWLRHHAEHSKVI